MFQNGEGYRFDNFKPSDAMEESEYGPVFKSSLRQRLGCVACSNVIQTEEAQSPEVSEIFDVLFCNSKKIYYLYLQPSKSVFIEPRSNPKPIFERKQNWLPEYIKNRQKDRIKWNSKLHRAENRFSRMSMYEQAEELMNIVSNITRFKAS